MSQPGFFFYTGDWLKDTRTLSLEARGAWIDLLCALHEAGGSVTWPLRAFDQYWGTIERDGIEYSAREILDEFATLNICSVVTDPNGGVTVTSRRLVRENNSRESNKKRQQRFREKAESNGAVTALGNASSSSSSSSSSSKKNPKKDSKTTAPEILVEFPGDWKWLEAFIRRQTWGLPIDRFLYWPWWDVVSEACGGLSEEWLEVQFAKLRRWLMDNPTRHPTPRGFRKFVSGWLERAHDRERRFPDGKTTTSIQRR